MRVVFDARYLNNPSSGIGVYCDNLLRQLLATDAELHFTLVTRKLGLAARYDTARCDELLFPPAPRSFATLWTLSPLVKRSLARRGGDLFHSPFNIIPSRLPCKSVVTIHDIMQIQDPRNIATSRFVQNTAGLFWRTRIRHATAHATHIAAVSEATKSAILEHFPHVPEQRVSVTPNGVDRYFFEPPSAGEIAEARQRTGPSRFVLCVGNESPHKNHVRAVRSFLRAFEHDRDVKFVLVRRSVRHDPEMVQLLDEPAARAQVIVLEHTELAVLRALYAEAHLFFFPSWVEGFGIPILEAMATGTPVVTADRSAPAEVAGDAALLADPFDEAALAEALLALDRNEALRAELVEKGRRRAEEFSWRRCAEATLRAYRRTLEFAA